uniref:DUF2207 domain-containing protein n=1 Tax=Syphacia muris TaxID=451379 RepID=A0A0N5AD22_9BILA
MNQWNKLRWGKEIYLALLSAGPLAYFLYHTERDIPLFSRLYGRLDVQVSDHLLELVESELDLMKDVKKFKMKVSLTDRLDGRVFGSSFFKSGAELQLPLRLIFHEADDAKKVGSILDIDAGIKKAAIAFDISSEQGELLLSRMQLSDEARRFVVRRELFSAQSGKRFIFPILLWCIGFGFGYGVLVALVPVIGILASFAVAASVGFLIFFKLHSIFSVLITYALDRKACIGSDTGLNGAVEYFTSSMKLCRAMRKLIGEKAFESITETGDCISHPVLYSERLAAIMESANK